MGHTVCWVPYADCKSCSHFDPRDAEASSALYGSFIPSLSSSSRYIISLFSAEVWSFSYTRANFGTVDSSAHCWDC